MEAPLRAQVGGDLVVTRDTTPSRRRSKGWWHCRLCLDVRVRSDDGSRHHEPLGDCADTATPPASEAATDSAMA
jgi:hypothetical protein